MIILTQLRLSRLQLYMHIISTLYIIINIDINCAIKCIHRSTTGKKQQQNMLVVMINLLECMFVGRADYKTNHIVD